MTKLLRKLRHDEDGSSLVEYTILLTLVLVGVITLIGATGAWVKGQWAAASTALNGGGGDPPLMWTNANGVTGPVTPVTIAGQQFACWEGITWYPTSSGVPDPSQGHVYSVQAIVSGPGQTSSQTSGNFTPC